MTSSTQRHYVRVIGDYGDLGDMAFAEVSDRLDAQLDGVAGHDFKTRLTSVPAFDTVATGFVLAQLAINSPLGIKHIFYVNTAPRKDKTAARQNNEGEGLVYAKLKNGVQIVAVNSGYSLTLIKPFATEIRRLNVASAGSQFRSRDIFPLAVGAIARGDRSVLAEDFNHAVPDDFPANAVVYTDGYGNLKTSVKPDDLPVQKGKRVTVEINGKRESALVGSGIFDVADGEYCFAKGSSGWTRPDGQKVEFSEVIKRGGNAAKSFGTPPGGTKVSWSN
jgi:S-adenosylmethionine hydrolase